MTANQYIALLEKELYVLNKKERQAVVRDFQKYFCDLLSEGETEKEIIAALGAPAYIAEELLKAYSEEDIISKVEEEYESSFIKVEFNVKGLKVDMSSISSIYTQLKNQWI